MRACFLLRRIVANAVFAVLLSLASAVPASARAVAPIEVARDARTERDFQQAQRAWADRVLLAPLRERARGKAWAADAEEFAGRALAVWPGDRMTTGTLPELSRDGQALLERGADDPLVGYLATWARWLATDEYYASREAFQKWMRAAEKLSGPPVLAWMCGVDFFKADSVVKLGAGDVPKRLPRLAAEAWKGGAFRPEEDFLFVRQLFSDRAVTFFEAHYDALWAALGDAGLPEWAAATIEGRVEIERAWKQRGVKFTDKVSAEQWSGFLEHLAVAQPRLVRAWELRPDQPLAAVAMIRLTMGIGRDEGEDEPRLWFDRAVAGQCDFLGAYGQYALSLTPRWGGSYDEMIALARACAETDRFDTEVPRRALTVLSRTYEEVEDFWKLYPRPEVAPVVLRVFRGYATAAAADEASRTSALADLAVHAHAAGDDAAAERALAGLGSAPLPLPARMKLAQLGIDEAILRGEVALGSGPLRDEFLAGKKARREKRWAEAKEAFAALEKRATGAAAARLHGLGDIVAVEEKLAAGEWATIPADPALGGWIQRTGRWHATPEGMPAITEGDGPVRIVHGAEIGANFEMRATLKISGEPRARWFQGLVFGDERLKRYTAEWHGAFVRVDKGKQTGTARTFFRDYVTGMPAIDCPLLETNEFTLRVAGEKLWWSVNGKPIHQGVALKGLRAETHVGFGSFKHTSGITTSLEKLEVRRLPVE